MGDNEYTERLKLFKEYEEVNYQLIDVINTKIIELKTKGEESHIKLDRIISVLKRVVNGTNKLIGSITSRKIDRINEAELSKVISAIEEAVNDMDKNKIIHILENDVLNLLFSYKQTIKDIIGGSLSSYVSGSMLMDQEKFIDIVINPKGLKNSIKANKSKEKIIYN